jgi:hypothetical protein
MRVVEAGQGSGEAVLDEAPLPTIAPASPATREGSTIDGLTAVRLFSQHGSLAAVSRELGVPIYELKKLSRTEFWQRELAELQRAEAALLNVKLTKLFDQVLTSIEDRVTLGDFIAGPAGQLKRVPLNASTLARVADSVFEKQRLVRDQPTSIISTENKKLALLASRLRALGAKDIDLLETEAPEIPFDQLPGQERIFRGDA